MQPALLFISRDITEDTSYPAFAPGGAALPAAPLRKAPLPLINYEAEGAVNSVIGSVIGAPGRPAGAFVHVEASLEPEKGTEALPTAAAATPAAADDAPEAREDAAVSVGDLLPAGGSDNTQLAAAAAATVSETVAAASGAAPAIEDEDKRTDVGGAAVTAGTASKTDKVEGGSKGAGVSGGAGGVALAIGAPGTADAGVKSDGVVVKGEVRGEGEGEQQAPRKLRESNADFIGGRWWGGRPYYGGGYFPLAAPVFYNPVPVANTNMFYSSIAGQPR